MKKKAFILLMVIYIAFIALGLPDALLGSAWSKVRSDLNVTLASLSIMSFLVYIMSFIATFNAPRLLRLLQTKWITVVSITFTGVALIVMSQVSEFWQMLFFAIPLGVGAGAIDVSLNHYLTKHYKASHMNYLHSFYGIGVTLGPSIMAYTLSKNSWRLGYIIIGSILLLIAFIVLLSFRLWNKEEKDNREEEHAHVSLKTMVKTKGALNSIVIFLSYVHLETLGGVWIASYFFLEKSVSYATAALFTTTFYLALTMGRLLSGVLSPRLQPKQMVLMGQILIVVASILLIINPFEELWTFFAITFLFGFGCAPIYPNMMYLNNDYFDRKKISKIISLQMAVGYIGFGVLTPLAGLAFDKITISIYPYVVLVVGVVLLLLTSRYFSLRRNELIIE
jgi:fucose permease